MNEKEIIRGTSLEQFPLRFRVDPRICCGSVPATYLCDTFDLHSYLFRG